MSDQPLPDLTNPAPKDIGQEPSPPQSLPSLGQSALTPQSETSNVSSPALNDHANTTSIDFSKATNGLQDTILSDILKAAAATPDLLQIPVISTSALLMSQTQGPTTTLTVPPVIEPTFVGSISRSTLDTMENSMGGMLHVWWSQQGPPTLPRDELIVLFRFELHFPASRINISGQTSAWDHSNICRREYSVHFHFTRCICGNCHSLELITCMQLFPNRY